MLLAEADIAYEDVRVGPWHPTDKPEAFVALRSAGKLAFDKLPLWEEPDGFRVVQSGAIFRYLARAANLYGRDAREAAACDVVVDAVDDMLARARELADAEPERRNQLLPIVVGDELPRWLAQFSRLVAAGATGHFVGAAVTAADVAVFSALELFDDNGLSGALEAYPPLWGFYRQMRERPALARYLSSPDRLPVQTLLLLS